MATAYDNSFKLKLKLKIDLFCSFIIIGEESRMLVGAAEPTDGLYISSISRIDT